MHWRAKVKGRRYSWRAFWRSSSGRGPPAAGWAGGLTPLPPDQALFDTDDRALVPGDIVTRQLPLSLHRHPRSGRLARPVRPGARSPCLEPTLAALRHAIADAIILAADLPNDAVIDVRLSAGEDLGDDVARAIEPGNRRADLHATQVALREDTLASVHDLLDVGSGYSVRDVAGAVGLSPGRVAQIA